MTPTAGAAIAGGAAFTTSTTGGGLTSAPGGGAPCGACAIATMDSAASTATTRILTSNHRLFILLLCKSLDFPVVVNARPCALRPAVDRRRPELACSQRGPCRLIQAAIAGGALDLALQHPAVHIDEKAQPHDLLDDLRLERRAHHLDDLARQAMDQRVDQHDVKDAHGDQRDDGSGRGLGMRVAHGPRRRSLAELPQKIIGLRRFSTLGLR